MTEPLRTTAGCAPSGYHNAPDPVRTLSTSASGTMDGYAPAMSKSHWKNSREAPARGLLRRKPTGQEFQHENHKYIQ